MKQCVYKSASSTIQFRHLFIFRKSLKLDDVYQFSALKLNDFFDEVGIIITIRDTHTNRQYLLRETVGGILDFAEDFEFEKKFGSNWYADVERGLSFQYINSTTEKCID